MSDYISELIKDYNGDSYEQFARYIYLTFQREIIDINEILTSISQ